MIILAVMTVLPACSGAAKAIDFPFIDVKTGEWYYDNVKYVFEKGIMKGTSDTSFSPEGSLSRAMCVTILHRASGEPETSENVKFRDVKSGEYYEKAVGWASKCCIEVIRLFMISDFCGARGAFGVPLLPFYRF